MQIPQGNRHSGAWSSAAGFGRQEQRALQNAGCGRKGCWTAGLSQEYGTLGRGEARGDWWWWWW